MRTEDLQNSKIKRIIIYWDYLSKLRIDPQAAIDFISYIFSISEQWIMKIIRTRRLDEPELDAVDLENIELEYDLIDRYAKKLLEAAKKERRRQGKLF